MRTTMLKTAAVAAATVLIMTGCSDGPAPTGGQSAAPGAGTSSSSEVQLIKAGTLMVCTHLPYAPFQFNDDSGKTVGFDVDMMNLVAEKLGVQQEIVDTPFEGIKSGQDLNAGKCDVAAAAMSITEEREKVILFSEPYFDALQALAVKTGSPVKSLADLKGKKLGGQAGTVGGDYARENAEQYGYEVVEYPDLAAQTQAVLTGQIDAAINDIPVWGDAIKKNAGAIEVVEEYDTDDRYGFGMKLGNTALKEAVDEVLATAKSDGTYDELYTKWIGTEPPK